MYNVQLYRLKGLMVLPRSNRCLGLWFYLGFSRSTSVKPQFPLRCLTTVLVAFIPSAVAVFRPTVASLWKTKWQQARFRRTICTNTLIWSDLIFELIWTSKNKIFSGKHQTVCLASYMYNSKTWNALKV